MRERPEGDFTGERKEGGNIKHKFMFGVLQQFFTRTEWSTEKTKKTKRGRKRERGKGKDQKGEGRRGTSE